MIPLSEIRPWFRACTLLFAAGVLLLLGMGFRSSEPPPPPASELRNPFLDTPAPDLPAADVFARVGLERLEQELSRYRLAGTFQAFDFADPSSTRLRGQLALVDDLNSRRQSIVREGERFGPFLIRRITLEDMTVTAADQEWTLQLTGIFAQTSGAGSASPRAPADEIPPTWEDYPALETSAWGHRIADNQWLIRREAIFEYAEQMMANPRRAIELYRSFTAAEPGGEENLAGFRLQMTGEREFFTAMGLADGDVVRRVNSMEMTNQARAEYLISEFMKSQMGAVVFDIERDGEMQKLIYIIR